MWEQWEPFPKKYTFPTPVIIYWSDIVQIYSRLMSINIGDDYTVTVHMVLGQSYFKTSE